MNLEDLPDRLGGLDTICDWSSILSLGEQQRLAFARVLLSKPKYVILDESTSALDVPNERRLYDLLKVRNITYISVGHRPTLLSYHQQVLELSEKTSWRLCPAGEYSEMAA